MTSSSIADAIGMPSGQSVFSNGTVTSLSQMKEWKPWETGPEPLEVAFWEVDKVPEAPQK